MPLKLGQGVEPVTGGHDRPVAVLPDVGERRTLVAQCDDDWLVATACWMVEDLYKSFFRECVWTPGVRDYIGATAPVVVEELPHYLHDRIAKGGSSDRRNR